jgi:hypothetical protein
MPDGLYERDILAWSEQQADLLRRLAAGERLNESIDWANVIDEVETVGRSELHACKSLLRQAMVHLLKQHAWPASVAARHWRAETVGLLADAAQAFSPSMRQRIDLAEIYQRALQQVRTDFDDAGAALPLPDACPFGLDELLRGDLDGLLSSG